MKTDQLVRVFEDQVLIKESVQMLCRDRLRAGTPESQIDAQKALDTLCWDVIALQGKSFTFNILVGKCAAVLSRSTYEPIRQLSADELANEICGPVAGW